MLGGVIDGSQECVIDGYGIQAEVADVFEIRH